MKSPRKTATLFFDPAKNCRFIHTSSIFIHKVRRPWAPPKKKAPPKNKEQSQSKSSSKNSKSETEESETDEDEDDEDEEENRPMITMTMEEYKQKLYLSDQLYQDLCAIGAKKWIGKFNKEGKNCYRERVHSFS